MRASSGISPMHIAPITMSKRCKGFAGSSCASTLIVEQTVKIRIACKYATTAHPEQHLLGDGIMHLQKHHLTSPTSGWYVNELLQPPMSWTSRTPARAHP